MTHIIPTDLDEQTHTLLITAAGADLAQSGAHIAEADLDRWLDRIRFFVETHDPNGDQAAIVESDLAGIQREFRLMNSILGQYLDIIRGSAHAIYEAREQRNAALQELADRPSLDALFEHVVSLLAAHSDLSEDDARRAVTILFNTDDDIMTYDVVDGLDALQRFRDGFRDIVDEMKTRRIER